MALSLVRRVLALGLPFWRDDGWFMVSRFFELVAGWDVGCPFAIIDIELRQKDAHTQLLRICLALRSLFLQVLLFVADGRKQLRRKRAYNSFC